jgi:hypothetical protein
MSNYAAGFLFLCGGICSGYSKGFPLAKEGWPYTISLTPPMQSTILRKKPKDYLKRRDLKMFWFTIATVTVGPSSGQNLVLPKKIEVFGQEVIVKLPAYKAGLHG